MISTITRRSFIVGGTSAATAAVGIPLSAGAQEAITVDQFRTLSARLTGATVAALDTTIAGELLNGFISLGRGRDLDVLAADPGTSAGAVANDIVAAWYSGSYQLRAGATTFGLTGALLWKALDFTKPPGVCGGATGYWADPYQN